MVMETVCEETMKEECFSVEVEKCEVSEEMVCNEVNETGDGGSVAEGQGVIALPGTGG